MHNPRLGFIGAVAVVCAALMGSFTVPVAAANPASAPCGRGWTTAFAASPSDPTLVDPRFLPLVSGGNQTYRLTVVPGIGGRSLRVHLTNRFRPTPIEIGHATVARGAAGQALPEAPVAITFGGQRAVTIAPGQDVVSDPVPLEVAAGAPLAVSVFVSGQGIAPTGHFTANATSYYTPPGSGDATTDQRADRFGLTTTALPLISAADVLPSSPAATVVAFGDSITDGYVAATYFGAPENGEVVDRNVRYPDFLQRRLADTGSSAAVVNAGISGNRVTRDGFIPMFGPSAQARLDRDVIGLSGVSDVVLMEGINDLGIPIGASYDDVVRGYTALIDRLHAAGIAVHLGTILPASNALADGITAPFANPIRLRLNTWIRNQRLADSVVDFDQALRNPANPNVLDPRFAGPDNLHPSPVGYRAMAEAVEIGALRAATCRTTT